MGREEKRREGWPRGESRAGGVGQSEREIEKLLKEKKERGIERGINGRGK